MPDGREEVTQVAAAQEEVTQLNENFDINSENFLRRSDKEAFVEDRESLFDAFALFDADADGRLTEEEVVAALTRKTGRGTELSEEAARATWQRWQAEFDVDKDGKISYEELAAS